MNFVSEVLEVLLSGRPTFNSGYPSTVSSTLELSEQALSGSSDDRSPALTGTLLSGSSETPDALLSDILRRLL